MNPLVNGEPPVVLYVAAHGGFAKQNVPLGGGGAVFEHLLDEWSRTCPFELHPITPDVLGEAAPTGRDLVRFGERDYARFSFAFEQAATDAILRHDPRSCVVLVNDVSEGPDFARLDAAGYRIFTIYHVDVVAYVTEIYLRGWVTPETTVRWERRLRPFLPTLRTGLARLIWAKQEASVQASRGLIVPSVGMRDILLRCYPDCPSEKIHVLPWGNWNPQPGDAAASDYQAEEKEGSMAPSAASLRAEFDLPDDAHVLLMLSRISPEKGQDLLLEELLRWEQQPDFPSRPLCLFICGEAAFMQGQRHLARLKQLASRLTKTRVVFPGFVTGARKRAFFQLADIYLFPSRHESYGLTLLEALAHGVPAVTLDHSGARTVMRPEFGELVQPGQLCAAISRLLSDDALRARMSAAARDYAAQHRFEDRAAQLAGLLSSAANA